MLLTPRASAKPRLVNKSVAVDSAASFCASARAGGGVPASGAFSTALASCCSASSMVAERVRATRRRPVSASTPAIAVAVASRATPNRAVGLSGSAGASGARPWGRPNTAAVPAK